jgi:dienelactone hydrolase
VKIRPFAIALLAVLACAGTAPSVAQVELGFPQQPEREVKLPGPGIVKGAKIYAPEGPGPFPAIVLSHTCSGLQQHVFEWAQRFLRIGYVVLVVDHLGPRGLSNNCPPNNSVSVIKYAEDDVAAMKHLRALPYVDSKRIVEFGLSYGGMAALRLASEKFRRNFVGNERFAAVVSLYPWCNRQGGQGYQDHQWNFYDDTTTPLLVLIGEDDDSDPRSCVEQAKQNAEMGMPVEIRLFPDTTHAFDHSLWGGKPVEIQYGRRNVTYRYNKQAVDAAWDSMVDFLKRRVDGAR